MRTRREIVESVSIVVNSRDNHRFRQFEERFLAKVNLPKLEVIRIEDAKSMAEGYNRGAERATGQWIFFCHDDIGILDHDADRILSDAMSNSDLFGPCGTTRLISGNWYDAGEPYNMGAVVAPDPGRQGEYRLELFGRSPKRHVAGIQALDGLFIACTRKVYDVLRGFDETRLKGFHTYDIDFTFRAYLAGFACIVANELTLLHDSNVSEFSEQKLDEWKNEQTRFEQRFEHYLEKTGGLRKHDNFPLDDAKDGPSARKKNVTSSWFRR
ncbi:glycosyltransferase [Caballeronia sp. INSB1]|uniref:glycosyltransferase n=1 Tax=Caballeronia sp. INSB1 TaxID=2921751 RepID=UPI00203241A9|nr:glycosyltransferase [Caballeronia sp. INSB1]